MEAILTNWFQRQGEPYQAAMTLLDSLLLLYGHQRGTPGAEGGRATAHSPSVGPQPQQRQPLQGLRFLSSASPLVLVDVAKPTKQTKAHPSLDVAEPTKQTQAHPSLTEKTRNTPQSSLLGQFLYSWLVEPEIEPQKEKGLEPQRALLEIIQ